MLNVKLKLLMCCLFLSATTFLIQDKLSVNAQSDNGVPVIIRKGNGQGGTDKDDPAITAFINGHTLSINFAQNIGSVQVDISDGQSFVVVTPDNVQAYITSSGSYTVTFTLPGGDEYYGNFVVF